MNEFTPRFGDFLQAILSREYPSGIGQPCSCGRGPEALRTCYCNDCQFFEACCPNCFVNLHQLTPHHWAEVWNGRFLERKDMSELGYVHTFGHNHAGGRCTEAPIFDFIIVDVNGVHKTKVSFCACIGRRRDRVDHLLEAAIFPSTLKSPELGFTFNLLKDFHLQTLTSKKSPYDYLRAIRLKTNNAFVNDVPVSPSFKLNAKYLYVQRIPIPSFSAFNVFGVL